MGIFDDILVKLGKSTGGIPELNICMMGARGTGKTSILTAIFSDSQKATEKTKLYFKAFGETASELINKRAELTDVFEKRESLQDSPAAGIAATHDIRTYHFGLGVRGHSEPTVKLTITDFPGEYLNDKPDEVKELLLKSNIVMLAVDTPYLMESDEINEEKNCVSLINKFFADDRNSETIKDKMVLIVPLKCEIYFHQGDINDVTKRISTVYKDLVDALSKKNVATVVTPIQTMGDVEFDSFVENSNNITTLSKVAKYRFYGSNPQYSPSFCVQPMYYLLTYVADSYQAWRNRPDKSIFEKLLSLIYATLAKDETFFTEVKNISRWIITDKYGYAILSKNSILNIR